MPRPAQARRFARPSSVASRVDSLTRGKLGSLGGAWLLASLLIAGCGPTERAPIDLEDATSRLDKERIEAPKSRESLADLMARLSAVRRDNLETAPPSVSQPQPLESLVSEPRESGRAESVTRVEANTRLADERSTSSPDTYRNALVASDPELRSAALDALADDASDAAMNILDAEFPGLAPRTQHLILDTFAQVGSRYALDLLRQRLADPDPGIRDAAAEYLSEIGAVNE